MSLHFQDLKDILTQTSNIIHKTNDRQNNSKLIANVTLCIETFMTRHNLTQEHPLTKVLFEHCLSHHELSIFMITLQILENMNYCSSYSEKDELLTLATSILTNVEFETNENSCLDYNESNKSNDLESSVHFNTFISRGQVSVLKKNNDENSLQKSSLSFSSSFSSSSSSSDENEEENENENMENERNIEKCECTLCNCNLRNQKALERHMTLNHKEVTCHDCSKIFYGSRNFKKHFTRLHSGQGKKYVRKKPFEKKPHFCESCKKDFGNATRLKIHNKAIHLKVKDYCCDYCGGTFVSQSALTGHRKYCKEQPKDSTLKKEELQCKICAHVFTRAQSLKNHIKAVHERSLVRQCHVCGQKYANPMSLKSHIDTMHSDKIKIPKYECGICKEKFCASKAIAAHYRTKHPGEKRLHCDKCNYQCDIRTILTKHMKSVHNIVGEAKYTCGRCKEKFYASHDVRDHYNTVHAGLLRFKCDDCSYETNSKQHLVDHLRRKHDVLY